MMHVERLGTYLTTPARGGHLLPEIIELQKMQLTLFSSTKQKANEIIGPMRVEGGGTLC
jgi:hypothetical protein